MRLYPFEITAHRRGASPIYLTCLAPSPGGAFLIGQASFPRHLITLSTTIPPRPSA